MVPSRFLPLHAPLTARERRAVDLVAALCLRHAERLDALADPPPPGSDVGEEVAARGRLFRAVQEEAERRAHTALSECPEMEDLIYAGLPESLPGVPQRTTTQIGVEAALSETLLVLIADPPLSDRDTEILLRNWRAVAGSLDELRACAGVHGPEDLDFDSLGRQIEQADDGRLVAAGLGQREVEARGLGPTADDRAAERALMAPDAERRVGDLTWRALSQAEVPAYAVGQLAHDHVYGPAVVAVRDCATAVVLRDKLRGDAAMRLTAAWRLSARWGESRGLGAVATGEPAR